MSKKEEIDQIIKESLTQEEAKFYDELEEQNLLNQLGDLFKTKLGWLIVIMNIVTLLMFALSIYCVVQFFSTDITNELIKWSGAFFICWTAVAMLKLFVWMQMDKNALLRELKRLELQVAAMTNKFSK
jgi:SNF2 family DNA or RNA helicase